MDEKAFRDFLEANRVELGDKMASEARELFWRLMTANRLWKATFGGLSEGPQSPGELQGTLMMFKLHQELIGEGS